MNGKNNFRSDIYSQLLCTVLFWPLHLPPNHFFVLYPSHPVAFAISSPPYTLPPSYPHPSILSTGCQAQIRCLGRELECCPSPRWVGIQEAVFSPLCWNNRTGRGSNWDENEKRLKRKISVGLSKSCSARSRYQASMTFDTSNIICFFLHFIVLECLFLKDTLS